VISLLLLAYFTSNAVLHAEMQLNPPLVVAADSDIDLSGKCESFLEIENLDPKSVIDGSRDGEFHSQAKRIISLPPSVHPYWCKFTLTNPTDQRIDLNFTTFYTKMNQELFLVHQKTLIQNESMNRNNFVGQINFGLHHSVKLSFLPGISKIYLKLMDLKGPKLIFQIKSERKYFSSEMANYSIHCVLSGLIFFIGFYNLFLYTTSRHKTYILYAAYALAKAVYYSAESGLMKCVLPPLSPGVIDWISLNSSGLMYVSSVIFSISFLNINKKTPRLNRVFVSYSYIIIFLLFAQNFMGFIIVGQFRKVVLIFSTALYIIAGAYMLYNKFMPAIIFIAAWIMGYISGIWFMLVYNGTIPYQTGFMNILLIGSFLEELTLSLATGLKARYDISQLNVALNKLNTNLEHVITERTKHIKYILKSIKEGIFSFSQDFVINKDYSEYLETIVDNKEIENKNIFEILFKEGVFNVAEIDQLKTVLGMIVGEKELNYELNAHLLPREITFNAKIIEVQWQPISFNEEGTIDHILVVLHDVTQNRLFKKEQEQVNQEMKILLQIASARIERFLEFYGVHNQLLLRGRKLLERTDITPAEVVSDLFRNMHTIKGNSRMYRFDLIVDAAHKAESKYSQIRSGEVQYMVADLDADIIKVGEALEFYHHVYTKYLHQDTASNALSNQNLGSWISDIGLQVVESTIIEGKRKPQVNVTGELSILMTVGVKEMVSTVFVQLVRNSLDHGIEFAAVRKIKNKPEQGRIDIRIQKVDQLLIIEYQDDGAGLDIPQLRTKGEKNGYLKPGATDDEVAAIIYKPGITTAKQLTDLSGRGVGMDAVKHFLEVHKGNIEIVFTGPMVEQHRTFKFIIDFPTDFPTE